MPENLKTLRRRVRSIRTTKQITRAMEMVSAAKLRRTSQILHAARPYAATLQQMLAHLAESEEAANHPLFAGEGTEKGPMLLVVMSSDRGLCGSFNANLIRTTEHWMRNHPGREIDLYCVGRKGMDHFRRARASIVGQITDLSGEVDQQRAVELAAELVRLYQSGRYASVHVVYGRFISTMVNRPTVEKFLPIDPDALTGKVDETDEAGDGHPRFHETVSYILEPSPAAVFEALVPKYLNSKIMILLAETMTSEHSARMMAMNNATKNSEELIDTLTLRLNKLRQASITTEMLEIVGGAEALKS